MEVARPPITARDQELLAYLARHRMVGTDHVRVWLGVSPATARGRLRRLAEADLVKGAVRFYRQPACWQITRPGLAAIGSRLPVPRNDLATHVHDIGVAWLWLAARDGAFGPLRAILSERELRSHDGFGDRTDPPLAVRVPGVGPRGGERRHYPDLLVVTARGERVAIELELTAKSRTRREGILFAYAAEPRIDHVLYLVRDRRLGEQIAATARRLGLKDLVHVQEVTLADPTRPAQASRVLERGRDRSRPARAGRALERERGVSR